MSVETQVAPVQSGGEPAQASPEDNDDDFAAGFSGKSEVTETPTKEAPTEPVVDPVTKEDPEAPKYAQITEEQLRSLLDNATKIDAIKAENKTRFDTAFGQLGGLKQRVEMMAASTPAGERITDDEIKAFSEEYPNLAGEPVFKKLLKTLKGTAAASAAAAPSPAFDPAEQQRAIESMVGAKMAVVEERIIDSSLNAVFPGWKQDVKSEKFGKWLNEQPDDIKQLAASNDVGDAARMLQLFRTVKPAAAPASTPARTTRQKQIEAAVNPKGVGGRPPGLTEDDEFMAGFNSA